MGGGPRLRGHRPHLRGAGAVKAETLETVLAAIEAKRPIVLATNLETGDQRLLHPGDGDNESECADVELALRVDTCIATNAKGAPPVFYQPFNPPLRMIVVGAVHIAQSLSAMAALTGYEVTIVDPRESFAAADRFPGVTLNLEWPDAAMESLALDQRCAVVTLTHDPKLDDPALQVAQLTRRACGGWVRQGSPRPSSRA